MEHFIKTIKSFPCIWNTELEDYKTIQVKETAWRCVIEQCDISDVREAKVIWKRLRDGHRQALRNRKSAGHTGNNWKYEELMSFLVPFLKNRRSSTNELSMDNFEDTFQSLSDSDNVTENSERSDLDIKKKKCYKRKKILLKEESGDTSSDRDILGEEILITEQDNCSVQAFFNSMGEMCKSLPEYLQIQVQRKVFDAIMDAREEKMRITNNF